MKAYLSSSCAVVVGRGSARCRDIERALTAIACECLLTSLQDAFDLLSRRRPDVVIISATERDPEPELQCLRRLHTAFTCSRYLFVASVSTEELAIAAFHSGADRYVKEPWSPATLQSAVLALLQPKTEAPVGPDGLVGGERLMGQSPAITQLRSHLARIALVSSNVLVRGETGTGKELVAELLHMNGNRASKPFLCLNTAAIPDALLENELFGHERGAFTGALSSQVGKLASAHGGTVFFDEIGEISPTVQAKLLRAIENKAIYRLGGTRSTQIDIRIIAATNDNLERAAAEGRFRKDLYYRLNVVRVDLPPLRERVDDIPLLINHYLNHFNRELGRSIRGLSPRAMQVLSSYYWPGNVRELRNVIEALLVNLSPETTGIVDVPPEVMRQLTFAVGASTSERERLLNALAATNWNKSRAASQLRCSRMTIYRKIHQYKLAQQREV
jgi:DNA-binding NtrC family response regulator